MSLPGYDPLSGPYKTTGMADPHAKESAGPTGSMAPSSHLQAYPPPRRRTEHPGPLERS